jgi:cytochrome d ubiquinol oxidase subunit II
VAPFANLNTAWFALIGVLWAGFLFLEGFDFGVAVVTPFLVHDDTDRRLCLNAVGPTWDGNEVWLLVAGGATFAAFPTWYARLFSGFYLALFLILLALIARGVSFEFRDKLDSARWKTAWDRANFLGSLVPAVVLGVTFTDLAHGLPLSPGGRYYGGILGLLHPIALLGGFASLAVFCMHGSVFLSLKTTGDLALRARRAARLLAVPAFVLLAATVAWVAATGRPAIGGSLPSAIPLVLGLVALFSLAVAAACIGARRDGFAFAATASTILLATGAVFARMFPAVLPSSGISAHSLTIGAASAGHSTLVVMTVVAAIFTPVVLAYQAWTYWVFRQRLIRPPLASEGGPVHA